MFTEWLVLHGHFISSAAAFPGPHQRSSVSSVLISGKFLRFRSRRCRAMASIPAIFSLAMILKQFFTVNLHDHFIRLGG